ncbi:MAG: YggT family protein [Alphaproteobacteria bacterium]
MDIIVDLLVLAINIYIFIIILEVALTWLIAFDVVNPSSPQAQNLIALLRKATDPVFRPLRRYIPPIGGIDITPLVVILVLAVIKDLIS